MKPNTDGKISFYNRIIQKIATVPKAVGIVLFIYFIQGVIHNLGHPVTPQLVSDMGIGDQYFGYYFAAMSLGLVLGGPVWGYLGDRGNKRVYIFVGLLVYSIGQYFFATIGDKDVMILFRFLSGLGVSSSVTLLMTHLIEHSKGDQRKIYLGWYQGLFVAGSSLGYFIGGTLPEISFFVSVFKTDVLANIFILQAVLNVVHATVILIVVRPRQIPVGQTTERTNFLKGITSFRFLDPYLILFLLSLMLISLGAINVSKYIEVYMQDQGFSTSDIGNFVGVTGFVSIAATVIVVPLVVKMKRDFTFMIVIQVLSAVIIFIVFRSNQLMVTLYSFFMLYVVLKAVYAPLEQHFIASHAKDGEYGQIMGVRQLFFSSGMVLGPLLGGWLYSKKPLYVFDFSVAVFLIGVLLLTIVGLNIKKRAVITE